MIYLCVALLSVFLGHVIGQLGFLVTGALVTLAALFWLRTKHRIIGSGDDQLASKDGQNEFEHGQNESEIHEAGSQLDENAALKRGRGIRRRQKLVCSETIDEEGAGIRQGGNKWSVRLSF